MSDFWLDVRQSFRLLLKEPRFAIVATLILGLGIGATTAVFSVARAVLLRRLPYPESDRLVAVSNQFSTGLNLPLSQPEYRDYHDQATTMDAVAGFYPGTWVLSGTHPSVRADGAFVSSRLLELLGARPALGRLFVVADETPGRDHVVVLSHSLWRDRFGADSDVVGRAVRLDGSVFTVVGVMADGFVLPSDFQGQRPSQLWVPFFLDPSLDQRRNFRFIHTIGHLRATPAATAPRAAVEAAAISGSFHGRFPDNYPSTGYAFRVISLREELVGDTRPVLLILVAAVGALLAITCTNLAILQSTRAHARRGEFAVRAALGAGRWRLVRQLAVESVILSAAGGTVGMVLARVGVGGMLRLQNLPQVRGVNFDLSVALIGAAVSIVTAVLCGLLPARQGSRVDLAGVLKVIQAHGRERVTNRILMATEVALAVVLLIGASLLAKSLWRLGRVDPGIRTAGVVTFTTALPSATYDPDRATSFFEHAWKEMQAIPGVTQVAITDDVPLSGTQNGWTFYIEGRPVVPGNEGGSGDTRVVSPHFFSAIGIPVLQGRDFSDRDRAGSPFVAIISQWTADTYWPHQDPMGQRIRLFGTPVDQWITIIGVVGDVRNSRLETLRRGVYLPFLQFAALTARNPQLQRNTMTFVVRAHAELTGVLHSAASVLTLADPDLPVFDLRTTTDIVSHALAPPRFRTVLVSLFAFLGALLAALGVYGVVAYAAEQRGVELGIRVALGARAVDVRWMILREGLMEVLTGTVIGVFLAVGLMPVLARFLFGVTPRDPAIMVSVPLLLVVVSLLAGWGPARRAARLDPVAVLRSE